jgi:hypothetical protein
MAKSPLLRELDRLSLTRIRHGDKDWLVRTAAAPAVAAVFRHAQITLPPRAQQTFPPKPSVKSPRKRHGRRRRIAMPL